MVLPAAPAPRSLKELPRAEVTAEQVEIAFEMIFGASEDSERDLVDCLEELSEIPEMGTRFVALEACRRAVALKTTLLELPLIDEMFRNNDGDLEMKAFGVAASATLLSDVEDGPEGRELVDRFEKSAFAKHTRSRLH